MEDKLSDTQQKQYTRQTSSSIFESNGLQNVHLSG